MKALFVGLGSIGGRHLRNLHSLAAQRGLPLEVVALRSSQRALAPELAALVQRQLQALPPEECYDVAFITGPTQRHAEAIAALRGRVGAFFIEKPIFDAPQHDLARLGLAPPQKAYVAAPMRFTALYGALKEKLEGLPVYAVRVICSSYLPSWRPGADYRRLYSAQRALGGGVTLDLIHEWDYLYDLFGAPREVHSLCGHFSHLEIDSDDLSVTIAAYAGFLCEVHLDYFGRGYRREAEIFTEEGSLLADFGSGLLTLPDGSQEGHSEEANARYLREMAYFLDYAAGPYTESLNSPARAVDVLKIALGE